MRTGRFTIAAALALTAATTAAMITSGVAYAAPDRCSSQRPANQRPAECPLLEFATPDRTGSFYTIDSAEAETARRNGFAPKSDANGIRLYTKPGPGMVALHRLRLKSGHVSYLVTANPAGEDRPARFVDEGPMGFVHGGQQPGTMKLCRYSKNEDWRVSRDGRQDLKAAGYANECERAPLGWVPQG